MAAVHKQLWKRGETRTCISSTGSSVCDCCTEGDTVPGGVIIFQKHSSLGL